MKTGSRAGSGAPLGRIAEHTAYMIARAAFSTAMRVYFDRVEVRNPERLPERGPVLIVSNHPAALTDALVLGTQLRRRVHFLAMSPLFQPWLRGVLMRWVGALPVYRREDDPSLTSLNESTFAACHDFFDKGGVVLIFPEGKSDTDRSVVQIKTGAARMALAQVQRAAAGGPFTLLPVGLYFEDRTRFRSEVILSVGEPIALGPHAEHAQVAPREAVAELTRTIQAGIESLIQVIPEPEATELVGELERLYLAELKARGDTRHDLELRRRVAECVDHFRRTDPERVVTVARQLARYRRKLSALRVGDAGLRELEMSEHWQRAHAGRFALACLGLPVALAGAALNGLPYEACGWLALRLAPHPTRISSAHMLIGLFLFPAWYLALGALAWRLTGGAPLQTGIGLAVAAGSGLFAAGYFRWWQRQPGFLRLPLLAARRRRTLARLRLERIELLRVFDVARDDFLAATNGGAGGGATP